MPRSVARAADGPRSSARDPQATAPADPTATSRDAWEPLRHALPSVSSAPPHAPRPTNASSVAPRTVHSPLPPAGWQFELLPASGALLRRDGEPTTPLEKLFAGYVDRLTHPKHAGDIAARLAVMPPGEMQATGAAAFNFVCEHVARLHVGLQDPQGHKPETQAREATRAALFAALERLVPYFTNGPYKDTTYLLLMWVAFQAGDFAFLERLLTLVPSFAPNEGAPHNRPAAARGPLLSEDASLPADFVLSATSRQQRRLVFADLTLAQIAARRHLPSIGPWCRIVPLAHRSGQFIAHCLQMLIRRDWPEALEAVIAHFGDLDLCAFSSRQGPLHMLAEAPARIAEARLVRMGRRMLDAGADPLQGMSTELGKRSKVPPGWLPPVYVALIQGRPQLADLYLTASQPSLTDEMQVARHLKRIGAIAHGYALSFETMTVVMGYLSAPEQADLIVPIRRFLQAASAVPPELKASEDVFFLIQGALLVAHQFAMTQEQGHLQAISPNAMRALKSQIWDFLAPHLTADNTRVRTFIEHKQRCLPDISTASESTAGTFFKALKLGYIDVTRDIPEMFAIFVSAASKSTFFKAMQCASLFAPWERYDALFTVMLRVRRLEGTNLEFYCIEGMLERAQGPNEVAAALRANIMFGDDDVQGAILRHAQSAHINFWSAQNAPQTAFLLAQTPPEGWNFSPIVKSMPQHAFAQLMQQQDAAGQTPLHLAAGRSLKTLKSLVFALGPDAITHLMQQDYFGRTPLQEALARGRAGCFSLLWRTLSKQNALDVMLSQALSVAVKRGHAHMVDAISALDGGAEFLKRQRPKLMQAALLRGDCVSLKRLVRQFGFSRAAFTDQPYHLLHDLARGGSVACLDYVRQHLGTATLAECAAWRAIDGRRAEDVCRTPVLRTRLLALRGITPQLKRTQSPELVAMEDLVADLSQAPHNEALEAGAIAFVRHIEAHALHDENDDEQSRRMDLAWQLATLLSHHSNAGMGHHFDEHAPSMSLAALRTRIDQGQKWGASQFSMSCIVALLQLRSQIIQEHHQQAKSIGVQTRNVCDARLCGQGFARDNEGGEPYFFRQTPSVRFVYLCKPEGVQFISIYPIPTGV